MSLNLEAHIHGWLAKQPVWLHRAAERMCHGEAIDATFIRGVADETLQLLRNEKLARPPTVNLGAFGAQASAQAFALTSIADVHGVNALRPGASLKLDTMAPNRLTVIFGRNGSGKTGFSRVLKVSAGKLLIK